MDMERLGCSRMGLAVAEGLVSESIVRVRIGPFWQSWNGRFSLDKDGLGSSGVYRSCGLRLVAAG